MANVIKLKRSTSPNTAPSLVYGELGLNVTDKKLYYGNASNVATNMTELIPKADDDGTTLGLAAFVDDDFDATNGVVSIAADAIETNNIEDGAVTNPKLQHDSVTVGSTEINLGTAATSLTGMVNIDCTNSGTKTIYGSAGANNVNIGGTSTTVRIPGNLQVDGDTVTTNVGTLQVEDVNIAVAYDNNAGDTFDFGLYGTYRSSGENFNRYSGIFRDTSATGADSDTGVWTVYDKLTVTPGSTVDTVAASSDYEKGDFTCANLLETQIDCGTF
jgi:hypothetical protein